MHRWDRREYRHHLGTHFKFDFNLDNESHIFMFMVVFTYLIKAELSHSFKFPAMHCVVTSMIRPIFCQITYFMILNDTVAMFH